MKSSKKRRKISKLAIAVFILSILCVVISGVFLHSISLLTGIETKMRIILALIIIVLTIILVLGLIRSKKEKNKKYILYIPIILIYILGLSAFSYYIVKTYNVVDKFTSEGTTYSSSLITLSSNQTNDIKKVTGKVGIVSDEDNIVGYQIPKQIIEDEKLSVKTQTYDGYVDLIKALYEEEIDYAFLPTNYVIMFSNYDGADFSKLDENTKIIYTKEKKVKNKKENKSTSLTKPFTILLMGVDSENEDINGSTPNGDSLMLITFNPNTLNATILSIPRDSYVPLACLKNQRRNKITHAASYGGEECMIETIQNFTDVTIDYYVKINFKGLVKIVDTLGGIQVDVPYSFCEQNSDRKFGNDTVYVEEGLQTLNGEQALAFSRNRHPWPQYCSKKYSNYESNDFIRGQNQQTVLKAILNKIKENNSLDLIYKVLDAASNSMQTNMTNSEILSLYNIGKDVIAKSSSSQNIDDIIGMQRLYLSGKDAYIYDSAFGLKLYDYVLYNESVSAVSKAMKINLGLETPTMEKEFSFDIDEEYEQNIVGQMDSGTTVSYSTSGPDDTVKTSKNQTTNSIQTKVEETKTEEIKKVTVPNFIGMTYSNAKKLATNRSLYLNVGNADDTSVVASQDTPAGTEVNSGVTIKLTFETKKEPSSNQSKDETTNDDKKDQEEDDSNDSTEE